MIFLPDQSKLEFDEPSHTYTFEGKKLESVNKVLSKYSIPFDHDGKILARKAAENGITVLEQKAIWERKGLESRIKGTAFHVDIESYLKTKRIPDTSNKKLVKQFSKIKFKNALYSEIKLYNLTFEIAGTTDIIEVFKDNSISLFDIKTSQAKKITRYSFGRKMLYPLNHIWDSPLDKYELQLSTYAYMLEEAGWWVRNLIIFHIDYDKEKIKQIPMQNRRNDIINMLEHYKQNSKQYNI